MTPSNEIESPTGLDLNPRPPSPVRLSKRAGILALVVVFIVAGLIGYGIRTRSQRSLQVGYQPDETKGLTAATDAGKAVASLVPDRPMVGAIESSGQSSEELQPPGGSRQPSPAPYPAATYPPPPQYREPSPEEKRQALAYEREQEAINAPTTARDGFSGIGRVQGPAGNAPSQEGGLAQMTNLLQALQGPQQGIQPNPSIGKAREESSGETEGYESQNMQDQKAAFLKKARAGTTDNYLNSTRTKPAGRYEIKAGWDIPAVLEQALNSDLPGEIKALVRENVYDTASGRYLLIPQGARLVGIYDSHVAYGQNGVLVVWNRIIFPDASSINLDGMSGQDAKGYTGLRYDVDNHYKRLLGFGLLTSAFSAAFQLSQPRSTGVLGYPSPGQVAAGAVGQQLSQLGADVTRRNLNVQPTIKVPIGYRFNVRVNRDMLFELPYRPIER